MNLATSPGTAAWVAVAAAEAAPPTLPPGHAHPTTCLNCATPLADKFCGHCGQSAATHRLTMGHFLHEIPHSIWHVDKGILHTLRELLLRPGPTILGYLRGQRARHFAPISLLLLMTGLANFLAIKLRIGELAQNMNTSTSTELREAQAHGMELAMHYMGWIYVALSPLIAVLVRRALRRAGLNLAEALVAALYITAAGNLLTLFTLPLFYWVRSGTSYGVLSICSSLGVTLYQSWAYGQLLFETKLNGWGRWWRGLLTAVSAYLLVMVGVFIIMFTMNWGSLKTAMDKEVQHRKALKHHAAPAPATAPAPAPH